MDINISYANIGFALVFFFILAIFSVVLATTTLTYCVNGILLGDENRKDTYKALFYMTIGLNVIFLPAVVNWHWLRADNAYDAAYHFIGYFGNLTLLIIASVVAAKDHLFKFLTFLKIMGICFLYLGLCYVIGMIGGLKSENDPNMAILSIFLGIGYASIQVLFPLYSYNRNKSNMYTDQEPLPTVTNELSTAVISSEFVEPAKAILTSNAPVAPVAESQTGAAPSPVMQPASPSSQNVPTQETPDASNENTANRV